MTHQELQQFIKPNEVKRGTVVEGTEIDFEIVNNSPFPYLCYEQSCGCLGIADLQPQVFKGSVKAAASGSYGSTYEMLVIGDRYVQLHNTHKGPKFFDPMAEVWLDNQEIPENPVKAQVFKFNQTITLWLDDGEDIYRINPNGQLETNPNKSRMVVPISFLVVKKPS